MRTVRFLLEYFSFVKERNNYFEQEKEGKTKKAERRKHNDYYYFFFDMRTLPPISLSAGRPWIREDRAKLVPQLGQVHGDDDDDSNGSMLTSSSYGRCGCWSFGCCC